ncbi:MAG TPA: hypothetical protein VGL93_01545 [Streptosporangiaceae bacterium]|jgi:hypothetical protein
MDAGVAALLGAAVGSVATLGTAIVSGRAQTRARYAQWRRQQRRDAYAALLGALHDRDLAMDEILAALRDGHDVNALDAKVERFVLLAREVHRAVEIVAMEGPEPIAEAAFRVIHASENLSKVVRPLVAHARSGDDARRTDDLNLADQRERLLYRTIVDFRAEATKLLNSPK